MAMRCRLLNIMFLSLRRFKSGGGAAHRRIFSLSDSTLQAGQLRHGPGQAVPGAFALALGELGAELVVLPEGAVRERDDVLQVAQQALSRTGHRLLPKLLLAAQVQQGLGEQPLSDLGCPPTPGVVELPDLRCAESMLRGHVSQALAGLAALACQRDQGPQRCLHRQPTRSNVLLDRLWQDTHQRKSLRHPRRAAVKAARKLDNPQAEAALELGQKPPLLQGAGALGHLKRPGKHQGVCFREPPAHSAHHVAAETTQSTKALVAVDHHETLRIRRDTRHRHRHDRHLLPLLLQAHRKPLLLQPRAGAQAFVAQVKLVVLQRQFAGRCLCRQDELLHVRHDGGSKRLADIRPARRSRL
jgi:hypothetical protein